jgi:hypothetical protein
LWENLLSFLLQFGEFVSFELLLLEFIGEFLNILIRSEKVGPGLQQALFLSCDSGVPEGSSLELISDNADDHI